MKFANARKLDRKSGVRRGEHGAPGQGRGARGEANLTEASSTAFSPSVGGKAILLVEARSEMAT